MAKRTWLPWPDNLLARMEPQEDGCIWFTGAVQSNGYGRIHNGQRTVGAHVAAYELRFTASGTAVTTFGLACNRRWQNRQTQEWEEAVSFFNVSCWGQLGENVAESIQKGTRVNVVGRLDQRTWETSEGDKRSSVEVVADEVGPSLRWATCQVVRNERSGSATSRSASGGGAPSAPAYDDEAPFARVEMGDDWHRYFG